MPLIGKWSRAWMNEGRKEKNIQRMHISVIKYLLWYRNAGMKGNVSEMDWVVNLLLVSESIERFIEAQAFLRSSDLAPRPPPRPFLPSASCLSFPVFLCVAGWAYLRKGRKGVGEEPNHTTAREPGPQLSY